MQIKYNQHQKKSSVTPVSAISANLQERKSGQNGAFEDHSSQSSHIRQMQAIADKQGEAIDFSDNRPEKQRLTQLEIRINSPVSKQHLQQNQDPNAGKGPIQRYAYIGNKYLNTDINPQTTDHKFYYNENKSDRPIGNNKTTDKSIDVIFDKYYRKYNSFQEFKDHMEGNPVDVGLAKAYGIWYRLPFDDFFVLGENHAGVNYRDVYKESNRKGKILGEAGTNSLDKEAGKLEQNNSESALPNEFKMENLASKAYYAYLNAWNNLKKAKSQSTSKPKTEDINEFSAGYNKKDTTIGRSGGVPYYKEKGSEERIYLMTQSDYDKGKTGSSILNTFMKKYPDTVNEELQKFLALSSAEDIDEEAEANHEKIRKELSALAHKVQVAMEESHDTEVKDGKSEGSKKERRIEKAEKVDMSSETPGFEHVKEAFGLRDHAMFISILKAQKEGFEMAGIGNNHAQNLQQDLIEAGVKNVYTLSDFTKENTNAISGN